MGFSSRSSFLALVLFGLVVLAICGSVYGNELQSEESSERLLSAGSLRLIKKLLAKQHARNQAMGSVSAVDTLIASSFIAADCGSSGTRFMVYKWDGDADPELVGPCFKGNGKVTGTFSVGTHTGKQYVEIPIDGLAANWPDTNAMKSSSKEFLETYYAGCKAAFKNNANAALNGIYTGLGTTKDADLDKWMAEVSIFFEATAGLRIKETQLKGKQIGNKATDIGVVWDAIKAADNDIYPRSGSGAHAARRALVARTIAGRWEGYYGFWSLHAVLAKTTLANNFLKTHAQVHPAMTSKNTVYVEVGGASLQIAFTVPLDAVHRDTATNFNPGGHPLENTADPKFLEMDVELDTEAEVDADVEADTTTEVESENESEVEEESGMQRFTVDAETATDSELDALLSRLEGVARHGLESHAQSLSEMESRLSMESLVEGRVHNLAQSEVVAESLGPIVIAHTVAQPGWDTTALYSKSFLGNGGERMLTHAVEKAIHGQTGEVKVACLTNNLSLFTKDGASGSTKADQSFIDLWDTFVPKTQTHLVCWAGANTGNAKVCLDFSWSADIQNFLKTSTNSIKAKSASPATEFADCYNLVKSVYDGNDDNFPSLAYAGQFHRVQAWLAKATGDHAKKYIVINNKGVENKGMTQATGTINTATYTLHSGMTGADLVTQGLLSSNGGFYGNIVGGVNIYRFLELAGLVHASGDSKNLPWWGTQFDWSIGAAPIYKAIIQRKHSDHALDGSKYDLQKNKVAKQLLAANWDNWFNEWQSEKFHAYSVDINGQDQEDRLLTFGSEFLRT